MISQVGSRFKKRGPKHNTVSKTILRHRKSSKINTFWNMYKSNESNFKLGLHGILFEKDRHVGGVKGMTSFKKRSLLMSWLCINFVLKESVNFMFMLKYKWNICLVIIRIAYHLLSFMFFDDCFFDCSLDVTCEM